jgi:signal transduction histidine kinase
VEEQRVALHAVGQSPGWVWCGARPLRHGGAVVAAVLLTRSAADSVDAERARQAAEAANRMKDEFLAMVSHELRTPLHAVLGWASILRQRKADPRAWEKGLEAIERNARVQAKLVEDLLDLSRIVSGKLHVALRPMDPLPTLQAAVDVVRPTSEAKGVALEVSTEAAAGCTVSGDPDRLQQVVWNLLVNAVKFTPAGGRVELRAGCEGGQLAIEVRDTGEGIPPDFMPFLFERFRQAHTGPVRTQLGLGLGLALVRHVVELHGGGVSAQSAGPGQGSTFRVVLPLLTAPGAGTP